MKMIDRFAPSSKACSRCGTVKSTLSLAERTFECEACHLVIDRDVNAAINIRAWAVQEERGAGVEPEAVGRFETDVELLSRARHLAGPRGRGVEASSPHPRVWACPAGQLAGHPNPPQPKGKAQSAEHPPWPGSGSPAHAGMSPSPRCRGCG